MKQSINEIKRMQQLAGLINENQAEGTDEQSVYIPYYIDDERGKELYIKYDKADDSPKWRNSNYQRRIKLEDLLSITGLTLDELEELADNYGAEGWSLVVNKEDGEVIENWA